MVRSRSFPGFSFSYRPWVYFFVFLAANTFLSYFSPPPPARTAVLVLGLALPLLAAAFTYVPPAGKTAPLFRREVLPPLPGWAWGVLFLGALYFYLGHLTTLSVWPNYDEGIFGFYALHVLNHGMDRLLYASCQIPPFYPAWLGLNFKLWGTSLENWWFWPAFFSLLSIPLVYRAALEFFSPSVAFFCSLETAFSFWPWILGRYSKSFCLMPLMGAWVLFCMGKYLRSKPKAGRKNLWAAVLGLSLGGAFYAVFLHWVALALMVILTLGWSFFRHREEQKPFGLFLLAFTLVLLPFALAKPGISYAGSLLASNTFPFLPRVHQVFSWIQMIFWGCPPPYYTYEPVWGGLLNPIWGSLVLLGLLEALGNLKEPVYAWLCAGFVLFLLPGVLSVDWEFFRIVPLLSVLIPLAAIGWARLGGSFSAGRSAVFLLALLVPAVGLDGYHLLNRFHHLWDSPAFWRGDVKSLAAYRAYGILKPKAQSEGMGLVFSDFIPGNADQTLTVADYDFNPVANPRLSPGKAAWAAVLANVNYQPFLSVELGPAAKIYYLSKDLPGSDGGWILWVGPVTASNQALLSRWVQAGRAMTDVVDQSLQTLSYRGGDLDQSVIPALQRIHPLFEGDAFLETCFCEKMADNFIKAGRVPEAIRSLEQAVQSGCPAAHLYYRLGVLWLGLGDKARARQSFQKALQAPLDFTQSSALLKSLPAGSVPPGES